MNKGDLVDAIASKASVSQKTADTTLTATIEAIVEAVAAGHITLVGFGSFKPRERQACKGRNPKTGDKMQIVATKVPAFSAGKLLKGKVSTAEKAKPSKLKKTGTEYWSLRPK